MRELSVLAKTLQDLRWQVVWYGIGLALLAALVVAIYPSYSDQLADFEVPEALQGFLGEASYGTPEGYLTAEFVSWVPIVTLIFAIMAGTSALAGEEANGTLDLLMAQPISRARLAIEKIAGITLATLGIALIACLGWLAIVPVDISISAGDLVVATLNIVPITLAFAFLSMWAGVAMPDRRIATGAVTALAVATFFLNYLARIVDQLKSVAWISPFNYYDIDILTDGVNPWKTAVLLVAALVFAVASVRAFQRREIGVRSSIRLSLRAP